MAYLFVGKLDTADPQYMVTVLVQLLHDMVFGAKSKQACARVKSQVGGRAHGDFLVYIYIYIQVHMY